MAWLGTWKKRIKLDIDYTNDIGASVTQFPITIFLKAANGDTEKVFDEITTNNLKMAITTSNGTTQMYGKIEKWDNGNQVGIIHTSLAAWAISADTSIYLYYDSAQADNSTYIGLIDSAAGGTVWDSYNKLVSHQVDATTSTVKDSTANNNDGTKTSANNPLQNAAGQIGAAQTYSTDIINHGTSATLDPASSFTISVYAYLTSDSAVYRGMVSTSKFTDDGDKRKQFYLGTWTDRKAYFTCQKGAAGGTNFYAVSDASIYNAQKHIVGTYDGTTAKIYVNGAVQATTGTGTMAIASGYGLHSGDLYVDTADYYWAGDLDEIRYSTGIARSAAWIKGEYNSLIDGLLAYGSEELLPTITGAAFLLQMI